MGAGFRARQYHFRGRAAILQGRRAVLRDFSLAIQRGGKYLLKGPSGCGKTTAVNLLLRCYDPDAGTVAVDGAPLRDLGSPYGCMTVVRQIEDLLLSI